MRPSEMSTARRTPRDIDEYIAGFPSDVQQVLENVRLTIKRTAPDAEEAISYQMHTFTVGGSYRIYFAPTRSMSACTRRRLAMPSSRMSCCTILGKGDAQISVGRADAFRTDSQGRDVQSEGDFGQGDREKEEKTEQLVGQSDPLSNVTALWGTPIAHEHDACGLEVTPPPESGSSSCLPDTSA
jgi:hypothetical protein